MILPGNPAILISALCSWQYLYDATELSTPWNNLTSQNDTLRIRCGRLLMGETNVEALLEHNNTVPWDMFIGSVDENHETYLQDGSDVTKYNDSSNSRSRKSSPRDSSRKKSKSTMDRGNVDKSNESLNLNNFDDHQGKERFGGSTHFGSTESLLEGRSDHGNDVDEDVSASMLFDSRDSIFEKGAHDIFNNNQKVHKSANADSMESRLEERDDDGHFNSCQEITESMTFDSRDSLFEKRDDVDLEENNRMVEPSKYHNKHRRSSSKTSIDIEDEVFYYLEKIQQRNGFSGIHIGDFLENTIWVKYSEKYLPRLDQRGCYCP
ncbi:hypothetical protein AK88_03620 [Plasmodium fragile]|uniref:Uncharacterized protein n=1 Tax=Plasmodium fragile TaxID=5857 RepID=A0A0D9QID9_PLAFR|nr:uncharacterized protein AK88_03620 [Plasmodium fragile]KJP86708.1 hypothetical protein AK88_03620 [Plasmodium fragile]